MGHHPLYRVGRAMKELLRETARLDDETWAALAVEIEDLYESIGCLAAGLAHVSGAPDAQLERLLRRHEESE